MFLTHNPNRRRRRCWWIRLAVASFLVVASLVPIWFLEQLDGSEPQQRRQSSQSGHHVSAPLAYMQRTHIVSRTESSTSQGSEWKEESESTDKIRLSQDDALLQASTGLLTPHNITLKHLRSDQGFIEKIQQELNDRDQIPEALLGARRAHIHCSTLR